MLVIYQKSNSTINRLFIVLAFSLLTSCVNGNPSHKPHISGNIEIIPKNNLDICFIPDFNNTKFTEKPLSGITFDIMKINKTQPNVANFIWGMNIPDNTYKGEEVCLHHNDQFLKENLIKDTEYTVCMRGISETLNQYVTFCQTFLYSGEGKVVKTVH